MKSNARFGNHRRDWMFKCNECYILYIKSNVIVNIQSIVNNCLFYFLRGWKWWNWLWVFSVEIQSFEKLAQITCMNNIYQHHENDLSVLFHPDNFQVGSKIEHNFSLHVRERVSLMKSRLLTTWRCGSSSLDENRRSFIEKWKRKK